jgi:outer membrane protein W
MKTRLYLLLVSFIICTVASAQLKQGNSVLSFNIGPVNSAEGAFGEPLNGGMVGLSFDKMLNKNVGVGVNITTIGATGEYADANLGLTNVKSSYRSFPSYLTLRYVFLTGKFQMYAAGGLGFTYTTATSQAQGEMGFFGFSGAFPLGFYWHLSENFFFNGNYTPMILDNGLVRQSALVNTFNFGFGWAW